MQAASSSNEATISQWLLSYFRGKGFSTQQAAIADASFLGGFQVESSFNPGAYNPREHAIGIAQWEKGRRTALDAYAARTGGAETNLGTQLGYLGTELDGAYAGVVSSLRGVTSITQGATVVDSQFEGSAGTTRSQRITNAQTIYGQLLTGAGLGTTGGAYGFTSGSGASNILVDPGNGAPAGPAAPYPAGSVSGPLTATQRSTMIAYIEAKGASAGTLWTYLSNGHPISALIRNLSDYVTSGSQGNTYDTQLLQAYNAVVSGGGFGTAATGTSWSPPGVVGDITNGVETVLKWMAKPLETFALNAFLVIAGVVGLIVALVVFSHADDSSSSSSSPSSPSSPPRPTRRSAPTGEAGEAGAGGDLEEIAAA